MKKTLLLVTLFTVLFATAQPQDSLFVWKSGVLVHKQSIKPADMDSITFKRSTSPTGINIAGPNVTDIDGNFYQSVTNCGLTFIKQNLNVSKYSDGTPIPQVTDPTQWANLTTGAWCYYQNSTSDGPIYGKLYNWYAVAGIYDAASAANPALRKKLAPTGWHIPSEAEWTQLTDCLGGESVAGGKMKSSGTRQAGTGLWGEPNTAATNESGFTGLPAGLRWDDGAFPLINPVRGIGVWWSSSLNVILRNRMLTSWSGGVSRADDFFGHTSGISVRCLRD